MPRQSEHPTPCDSSRRVDSSSKTARQQSDVCSSSGPSPRPSSLTLTCASSVTEARPQRPGRASSSSPMRSEEHTSELQSLMRISYAVFCLKKKKQQQITLNNLPSTHTKPHH